MQLHHLTTTISTVTITILLTHFSLVLAQECYMPDRKTVATGYTPCNTSAIVHTGGTNCCAFGAACLSPGLCYLQWDMSINTGACTDSTWSTKSYFQGCPVDYDSDNVNTLHRCNDNQWCCSLGGNVTSCCNDPDVISFDVPQVEGAARIFNGSAFAPGYALIQAEGSTASAAATEPTSTVTISGNTCPTVDSSGVTCPAPSTNKDGEATIRVGVGVGVGIGVPLLFALATTVFALFREKQRSLEFQKQAAVAAQQFRWEQPGSGSVHEMCGRMGDDGAREMVESKVLREMST